VRRGLLEFDEQRVRVGRADVLAVMLLSIQPPNSARLELDIHFSTAMDQASLEGAQRVHHAVRVTMR